MRDEQKTISCYCLFNSSLPDAMCRYTADDGGGGEGEGGGESHNDPKQEKFHMQPTTQLWWRGK